MQKTPKFLEKISALLENTKPKTENCNSCGETFNIKEEDIETAKKYLAPLPTDCYHCRRKLRLSFANYTTFFNRDCDAPNHKEKVISLIPEEAKCLVEDCEFYWGEKSKRPHVEYNKNELFFDQFTDLFKKTPQPSLTKDASNFNSPYTAYGNQLKNCYFTFGGLKAEEVDYSTWPIHTRQTMDILIALYSENCYECVFPEKCYNCKFTYFSKNCLDCDFCYDCRNCISCFGCVNLRHRKYCFFNQQLSRETYKEKIKFLRTNTRSGLLEQRRKFWEFVKSQPTRGQRNEHSINSTGNYIVHSKNCKNCFWVLESENVNNGDFLLKLTNSADVTIGSMSNELYSVVLVGRESFGTKLSVNSNTISECEYVMNCKNCNYCFGCIGLENKKYCVLNKQYDADKYWELVDEIKTKMLEGGSYGKFFSLKLSPFPCSFKIMIKGYPSDEKSIMEQGGFWHHHQATDTQGLPIIELNDIPDSIEDVGSDITDRAIKYSSKNLFKIIKHELEWYKRKSIPIPSQPPFERMHERFQAANNFQVMETICSKCHTLIESAVDPKENSMILCEKCYQKEII